MSLAPILRNSFVWVFFGGARHSLGKYLFIYLFFWGGGAVADVNVEESNSGPQKKVLRPPKGTSAFFWFVRSKKNHLHIDSVHLQTNPKTLQWSFRKMLYKSDICCRSKSPGEAKREGRKNLRVFLARRMHAQPLDQRGSGSSMFHIENRKSANECSRRLSYSRYCMVKTQDNNWGIQ